MAEVSKDSIKMLKIKDFLDDSRKGKQVALKHPVCLECFDEILKQLEGTILNQEAQSKKYKEQLLKINRELLSHEDKSKSSVRD